MQPFASAGALLARKMKPPQGNPMEPGSFPMPHSRTGDLPAPQSGMESREFRLIDSGTAKRSNNVTRVTGGFHAVYKGYDLTGDELEFNHVTEVAIAKGNVKIVGQTSTTLGEFVTVDFKKKTFRAEDADVILKPSFPGNSLLGDLYLKGGKAEGTENRIQTEYGKLTTCDLDHPHYVIDSDRGDVRRNKRIILRDSRLKILGNTVIGIPYLSIPIVRERTDRYTPDIGQSQDEGYYIKAKFPVGMRDDNTLLDLRTDYMTKLGSGMGANLNYDYANSEGQFKLYGLFGATKSAEFMGRHSQTIGKLRMALDGNWQRQNYLNSPENTSFQSGVRLNYGPTSLNFNRNQNDSPGFSNSQQLIAFRDDRAINARTRTSLDLNLSEYKSSYSSGTPIKREQLDVRFLGSHELRIGTAQLEYVRAIPVGGTENFFESGSKTPVFSFRSDSGKLLGQAWANALPMQLDVSIGEYTNPGLAGEKISRGFLDWRFSKSGSSRRMSSNFDFNLRQGVYSDDTAQYAVQASGGTTFRFGPRSSLNWRYSYQTQHGYSPVDFDILGKTNFSTVDLSLEPLRRWTIGAQTGYDFEQEKRQNTAWQMVGVRTEWRPKEGVSFKGYSMYDTFRKGWSTIRMDVNAKQGPFQLTVGTRYDAFRHTWGNLNIYMDGLRIGRLGLATAIAYNGYTKQFDARHYSLIYDLHCAEAVLQVLDYPTGFRAGRTVSFFVRLKALPFDTPFGTGRRGESFGMGSGREGF